MIDLLPDDVVEDHILLPLVTSSFVETIHDKRTHDAGVLRIQLSLMLTCHEWRAFVEPRAWMYLLFLRYPEAISRCVKRHIDYRETYGAYFRAANMSPVPLAITVFTVVPPLDVGLSVVVRIRDTTLMHGSVTLTPAVAHDFLLRWSGFQVPMAERVPHRDALVEACDIGVYLGSPSLPVHVRIGRAYLLPTKEIVTYPPSIKVQFASLQKASKHSSFVARVCVTGFTQGWVYRIFAATMHRARARAASL